MRRINGANPETLAGVHMDNLEKSKKINIGANLYSCLAICKNVSSKTENRIGSICMLLKQKEKHCYSEISKNKKIINSQQGITLLALVVTVVIMLILAAVGIGLVVRR